MFQIQEIYQNLIQFYQDHVLIYLTGEWGAWLIVLPPFLYALCGNIRPLRRFLISPPMFVIFFFTFFMHLFILTKAEKKQLMEERAKVEKTDPVAKLLPGVLERIEKKREAVREGRLTVARESHYELSRHGAESFCESSAVAAMHGETPTEESVLEKAVDGYLRACLGDAAAFLQKYDSTEIQ